MQIIVNVVDHGLPVDEAIAAARVHLDGPTSICEGGTEPEVAGPLSRRGLRRRALAGPGATSTSAAPRPSGSRDGALEAAGDPRRGGAGVVVAA